MPLTQPLESRSAVSVTVPPVTGRAAVATLGRGLEALIRLGYVIRGIIYLLPGVLALRVALGPAGHGISPTTPIELIGREPFGRMLLLGVGVGLAGYAAWGVIRAVFDPLRKGRSPSGLALRGGYAISALAYMGLLAATFQVVTGPQSHGGRPINWISALLAKPFGEWMVGIIGVCWIIGAGFGQILSGWRGSFMADLATERMGRSERRWANRLGRVGVIARGAVFTVIGALMVNAALHAGTRGSADLRGALVAILHQPFGRALLSAAAVGLIAFGAFSVMCARWMRIRTTSPSSPPASFHAFVL